MNKEFILYEQALSMKKLGFVERCFGFYTLEGYYFPNTTPLNSLTYGCDAPLYQQAFRWFRDNHQLHSYIERFNNNTFDHVITYDECDEEVDYGDGPFNTYEEAELACLIKLIEIVKNK